MKIEKNNRFVDKFKSNLFIIEIISLITVIIWVGLSIYFSYSKTEAKAEITSLIKSINPNLDREAIIAYKSSRISLPDTFEVVAVLKEGKQTTEARLDLGPVASSSAASSSAATKTE